MSKHEALQLEPDEGGKDYILKEEWKSVWITVGKISVYISNSYPDTVMVEAYEVGKEAEDHIIGFEVDMEGNIL